LGKRSFLVQHHGDLHKEVEMDNLVVVSHILPCDPFLVDLLSRSFEENVLVEGHFTIDQDGLYVDPLTLVDHLHELHLGRPWQAEGHHISLELEVLHIVDVMANKSLVHPFPCDSFHRSHLYPFHRSHLYPFLRGLEVHPDHTFLGHKEAFCFRIPYFLLGFGLDPLVVHMCLDFDHILMELLPFMVEHRILQVNRAIEVACHHSLGVIHILHLTVDHHIYLVVVKECLVVVCFFDLHNSF